MTSRSQARQHMETLSRLMFSGYAEGVEPQTHTLEAVESDLRYVAELNPTQLADFFELANAHHVLVRALTVLKNASEEAAAPEHNWIGDTCELAVANEKDRIKHAIAKLHLICEKLEANGCKIAVIKSLDHWPDLGSDLDLYTDAKPERVIAVMREELKAKPEPRSWGDRLAGKWNFSVPGLPELVEIHVRYLGQTGEHKKMARRVIERRAKRELGGYSFLVAAPEERILISTLQRMYRHFYFRLCDMADTAALLQSGALNFGELKKAAKLGGIWDGVATYLYLVKRYAKEFGANVPLPEDVMASSCSPHIRVHFEDGFLRVPKLPAAGLYGAQLWKAGVHRDFRAVCRLPLLPPLAVSALVAYRLTGSDKGVW